MPLRAAERPVERRKRFWHGDPANMATTALTGPLRASLDDPESSRAMRIQQTDPAGKPEGRSAGPRTRRRVPRRRRTSKSPRATSYCIPYFDPRVLDDASLRCYVVVLAFSAAQGAAEKAAHASSQPRRRRPGPSEGLSGETRTGASLLSLLSYKVNSTRSLKTSICQRPCRENPGRCNPAHGRGEQSG